MKVQTIFLTIFLIQKINPCESGCISCTSNNVCRICDFTKGYQLLNGACSRKPVLDCVEYDFEGNCIFCNQNHYPGEEACIEVTNQIEKCFTYKNEDECLYCYPNYYLLQNGMCRHVDEEIDNCKFNLNNEICENCHLFYETSYDQKSCVPILRTGKCEVYSNIQCNKCKEGFVMEPTNGFGEFFATSQPNAEFFANFLSGNHQGNQVEFKCQQPVIENCDNFENSYTCSYCRFSYYLLNGSCQSLDNPIDNCQEFNEANICVKCLMGYHLNNPEQCIKNETIDNCLLYSQVSDDTTCLQCSGNRYYNGAQCVERRISIDNCVSYEFDSNNCQICDENYIPNETGQQCITKIDNCMDQVGTDCQQCMDMSYYNPSAQDCIEGNSFECLKYNNDSNCKECTMNYFLDDFQCKSRRYDRNCKKYLIEQDQCHECIGNRTVRQFVNKCTRIEDSPLFDIMNCENFNEDGSICLGCRLNFYLQENLCKEIEIEKCCKVDPENPDICILCHSGYITAFNQCVKEGTGTTNNCHITSADNDSNRVCEACEHNAVPIIPKNTVQFICEDMDNYQFFLEKKGANFKPNCTKYREERCLKCADGFYLNFHNTCVDFAIDCPYTIFQRYIDSVNEIIMENVCLSNTHDECKITNYLVDLIGVSCTECKTGHVKIINYNENQSMFNFDEESEQFNNYLHSATCNTIENASFETEDNNPIDNCQYYIIEQEDYLCIKCEFGYTELSIEGCKTYENMICTQCLKGFTFNNGHCERPDMGICEEGFHLNDNNTCSSNEIRDCAIENTEVGACLICNSGFVVEYDNEGNTVCKRGRVLSFKNCSKNYEGCDTQTKYLNLDARYEALYSCHKCSNQNKIPFVSVSEIIRNTPWQIEKFGINKNINLNMNTNDQGQFGKCLSPNTQTFGVFIGFPNNCALGLINASLPPTTQGNDHEASIMCIACQPGYQPIYEDDILQLKINSCLKIDDCKSERTINGCDEPEDGFVFTEEAYESSKFDEVVEFSQDNRCTVADRNGNECLNCEAQYFLFSGICIKLLHPRCEIANDRFNQNPLRRNHFVFDFTYEGGCDVCENGFVNHLTQNDHQAFCSIIPFTHLQEVKESEDYPENCRYLSTRSGITEKLECYECQRGSIGTDGSQCVEINDSNKDCSILNSNNLNECLMCVEGYSNINGICTLQTLQFCAEFHPGINDQEICIKCEDGFFLDMEGVCQRIQVDNCKRQYRENNVPSNSDPFYCEVCLRNYALVTVGGRSLCQGYSSNCLDWKEIGIIQKCQECSPGHFLEDLDVKDQYTECFLYQEVLNCEEYNNDTQECEQCSRNFYLDDQEQICIPRLNLDNCTTFDLELDICLMCDSGHYLNNGMCIQNNDGVVNCLYHSSKQNCQQCLEGFVLRSNTCQRVYIIENCLQYDIKGDCTICQNGFLPFRSKCEKITAQNCRGFISPDACLNCQFGFKMRSFETSCDLSFSISNICIENDTAGNCTKCNSQYYLNNGVCRRLRNQVDNCLLHGQDGICSECEDGQILTRSGKCFRMNFGQESNCQNYSEQDSAFCTFCTGGFLLNQFKGCFTNPNDFDRNCWVYDNATGNCQVCNHGFMMTNTNICLKETVRRLQEVKNYNGISQTTFLTLLGLLLFF